MKTKRNLILVTGTPRSATTTVGDMLGAAPGAGSLYEPMNFHAGDRCIGHYFEVPGQDNFTNEIFDDLVERMRRLDLDLKPGVWPEDRGLRRVGKYLVGGRTRTSHMALKLKPGVRTLIWKDPLAAFAATRAARVHRIPVVVTLRSPHAVAASFKRMKWGFNVKEITRRIQALGSDGTYAFDHLDLADHTVNAAVLWRLVYGSLAKAAEGDERIVFVDTDRLLADPQGQYRKLYNRLGLQFTSRVERRIEKVYAPAPSGAEIPAGHAHTKSRDVSTANTYWRKMLSEKEIDLISKIVAPVDPISRHLIL